MKTSPSELLSVHELAQLLFVSPRYARRLMQRHALRPVTVIRGQKFVKRQKAATYRRKMKRRQHAALGRMIAASDHAGLYDIEAYPKTLSIVDMAGSLKPQKRVDIEDMNPWKS